MRSLVPLLVALLAAQPGRAADGPEAEFEREVRPVLAAHCARCHGPEKQKGGLRLDSREAALAGGDAGPALVPGDPDQSPLVAAVRYHDEDLQMPPAGKLGDAQIAAIERWVKNGAAWPGGATPKAAPGGHAARAPGKITDEDRAWWAFRPVRRPELPAAGEGWAVTPIDRFVAHKLETSGRTPARSVDARTLIRRLTFDLTGLPPTPEEVAAFEQSAIRHPQSALESAADRLLASPRYGERWGRMWLDLVRYAESDGYRVDGYRPHAWRYRDYVIRSLNADKPFDRFVREQIAGDELYPNDPDALVATGYLRHGVYEYNQRDVRTQWNGILNEITDVTADAFLGMSVQCARCHDHKFDPILQKDYFALRAFFAGLSFRDEPVFDSPAVEAEYERKRRAYDAESANLREKIDSLILGHWEKVGHRKAAGMFPPDIEAILLKPAGRRTPDEQQLAELAERQYDREIERTPGRLPAGPKAEVLRLKKQLDTLSARKPAEPVALIARDLGPKAAETVIPGGRKQAAPVEPAFLTVLTTEPPVFAPASGNTTGRRSALANWLTRPDHPLTARVMVNRVWQGHFGVGLVGTPNDFGTLGDRPTDPELLEWLAAEFVESGWSLKQLHRLIVTSAAYRAAGDQPGRRLDAEQLRDAMLAVSGELEAASGGPAVPATKPRRSVYTRQARNSPDPLLAAFDAADGLASCARRNNTATPTQSLLMLNGDAPMERARAFAGRVMPADGKNAPAGIDAAFRLAFGRAPTAAEKAESRTFLVAQVTTAAGGGPIGRDDRLAAWADFCHALLISNEFLTVD